MARQIVGEIYLNVKPLDGGVSQGVQRIIDTASDKSVTTKVSADTKGAEEAVGRLSGSIEEGVGGAWARAAAEAATFTATVYGIQRAIEGAVGKLAGTFDQLAQAQAGFTSILGSESGGARLLDEIREFARVSPFVTQELVNYSQQLLGVGKAAESIVPLLEDTGNIIASVGGDTANLSRVLFTLTQIQTIGRLTGQDAMQLQSALIPITQMLARHLNLTTQEVKKLQEQGQISAETVFAAITEAGDGAAGAMAGATRNIAGARSVLSDTLTIMAQESVFLQNVFDDIVQGILTFSEALGDPAIQNTLDSISEDLNRAYESLQPLISGFAGLSGDLGVNALSVLASTLEILASALEAVPAPILEQLGRALAIYATLKAPIMLVRYVENIRTLLNINFTKVAAGIAGTTTQIERQGAAFRSGSAAIAGYNVNIGKLITTLGFAAIAAGTLTTALGDSNDAAKTVGDTLTFAGLGAQLGSTFGPTGTVVGLLAGGAIGAITSFVGNAREEAERRAEEIKEIGAKAAEQYLSGFELTHPGGLQDLPDFTDFFGDIDELRQAVVAAEDLRAKLEQAESRLEALAFSEPTDDLEARFDRQAEVVDKLREEYDKATEASAKAQAQIDAMFKDAPAGLVDLSTRLAALNKELPEFKLRVEEFLATRDGFQGFMGPLQNAVFNFDEIGRATGQMALTSVADVMALEEALIAAGTTIEEVLGVSIEELIIQLSNELPLAINEARSALNDFYTEYNNAKKAQEEFFKPFQQRITQVGANRQTIEALNVSFNKLAESAETVNGALNPADGQAFADKIITAAEELAATAGVIFGDVEKGRETGLSFALTQIEAVREELNLTDAEFQQFLTSAGLAQFYFEGLTETASGFTGTVAGLAEELNVPISQLREMLQLSGDLSREDSRITISSNILELIERLEFLRSRTGAYRFGIEDDIKELEDQLVEFVETGSIQAIPDAIKKAMDASVTHVQNFITELNALQSRLKAGSGLADAFEQILATGEGQEQYIQQLISMYEGLFTSGVNAGLTGAKAQANALSLVNTQLTALQDNLNLSNDEFAEMLSQFGVLDLYNQSMAAGAGFFGSISDYAAQLGVTEDKLKQVLELQAQLSGETTITVTADISQALAALEELEHQRRLLPYGEYTDLLSQKRQELRDLIDAGGAAVTESTVLEDYIAAKNEEARKEAERLAAKLAEEAQREAERLAEEQRREAERIAQAYSDATERMEDAILSAAEAIRDASESWVASIKERTQQEQAVSIDRLLRNAGQQTADLGELGAGIEALRARGLSDRALQALEIDNVTDLRQVRRLLQADPAQLAQLSSLVGQRDSNAEIIARRQQQAETQATIVAAIVQAAAILGYQVTPEQAQAISAQIIVDGRTVNAELPPGFLEQLLNVGQLVN